MLLFEEAEILAFALQLKFLKKIFEMIQTHYKILF